MEELLQETVEGPAPQEEGGGAEGDGEEEEEEDDSEGAKEVVDLSDPTSPTVLFDQFTTRYGRV